MADIHSCAATGLRPRGSVWELVERLRRRPLSAKQLGFTQVLTFSFAVAFVSSLGQTFFISLFIPSVQKDLSIDSAAVGSIYGAATLAGALILPWFGAWFDRTDLLRFTVAATLILVAGCAAFAGANGLAQLFMAFALLRLVGPGLYSHIASAGPARYFVRGRGTVLSLVALGFTAGEGLLPSAAVHAIGTIGWRQTFAAAGAAASLLIIPAALRLVRRRKRFRKRISAQSNVAAERGGLLAFGLSLWPMLPVLLLPAGLETALIFHQGKIAAAKGLGLAVFATAFIVYALAQVAGALAAGRLIDRFGSFRVLVVHAAPMAAGCLALAASDHWWAVWLFMAGTAVTATANSLLRTTLVVEVFGSSRVGEARSRLSVLFAVANAAGPPILGIALAVGVTAGLSLLASGLLMLLAAGLALARPVLRDRAPMRSTWRDHAS